MRLWVEFYLDEDVSVLLATLLRARGFSARTTEEEGRKRASDADQLAYATDRGWTIITHNRKHFEALDRHYRTLGQTHAGIIIATRQTEYPMADRLADLFNHLTADEMAGLLLYI
jgi:hypothetical protein